MSKNVVVRAVDEHGYIVLPAGYRAALGIEPGDLVSIDVSGARLLVRKSPDGTILVDELGRIHLTGCDFQAGQTLECRMENGHMALFATNRTCAKCGGADTLQMVHGETLCLSCVRGIDN